MNSLQIEFLFLNLFYAGLVTTIIIVLNKFEYLSQRFPSLLLQLKVLVITLAVLVVVAGLDTLIFPVTLKIGTLLNIWHIVSLILIGIFISFGFELFAGFLIRKGRHEESRSNFNIIDTTSTNNSRLTQNEAPTSYFNQVLFHALFVGVAILEEIIFRGVVLQYLLSIGTPLVLSLTVSSIAFGVNHFFRGPMTVIQKSAAGAIFGIVAYQAEFYLLVPIIAHIGENYLIILINYIRKQTSFKRSRK